ncbi:MAG: hypothetical protein LBQ60_07980 [Bacteroidales bacterium]|jgi:hypothetical protein|nr:hypothetical protein [Bacteroidales bacterium]
MKKITLLIALAITVLIFSPLNAQNMKMKIIIGNKEFTATLNDSEAAKELVKLLPMEVNMGEHNGNEKYYNLPDRMPGKATNPGSVQAGDLMIWSSNTLVLFYAGSRTSYSYIRVGKIDDTSGLQKAVGRGSIKVKYELLKPEKE